MTAIHVITRIMRNQVHVFGLIPHFRSFIKFRTRTMIPLLNYCENLKLVEDTLKDPKLATGSVVECGCWKGGMAAGLLGIGGAERKYFFFDSFEGLPPVSDLDGQSALRWQLDQEGATFHDNNYASIEDFESTIAGVRANCNSVLIYKGWFSETVPKYPKAEIAVLRLDGDWYESTMDCLVGLWDYVQRGGIVIIDDYLTWDGCSRAVHDFLSSRKLEERIQIAPFGTAFIRKRV